MNCHTWLQMWENGKSKTLQNFQHTSTAWVGEGNWYMHAPTTTNELVVALKTSPQMTT